MNNSENDLNKEKKSSFNPQYFRKSSLSEKDRVEKEERRLISHDRPKRVRIFKNDFLERLTLVKPQTIFIVWIPVCAVLFYRSAVQYGLSLNSYLLIFILGLLTWSLAEYVIHRYVFHLKPSSDFARKVVYSAHGNHHDDPFDPLRGVMPIVPALLYVSILYGFFYLIVPAMYLDAFFASFLIGYLLYDGIHYYTHHARPKYRLGKYLRRIHLVHHVHDDVMFGISSPLWDIIFSTYRKKGYRAPKAF